MDCSECLEERDAEKRKLDIILPNERVMREVRRGTEGGLRSARSSSILTQGRRSFT
jgi:hypothetical protein